MPISAPSQELLSALRTRLLTVPSLPVQAWDNVVFDPTPGVPYVEDHWMTSSQRAAQLGPATALSRGRYLYQINLVYPEGIGLRDLLLMADAIARTMRATPLPITGNPDVATVVDVRVGPRLRENQWITVPVTCTVDMDF